MTLVAAITFALGFEFENLTTLGIFLGIGGIPMLLGGLILERLERGKMTLRPATNSRPGISLIVIGMLLILGPYPVGLIMNLAGQNSSGLGWIWFLFLIPSGFVIIVYGMVVTIFKK